MGEVLEGTVLNLYSTSEVFVLYFWPVRWRIERIRHVVVRALFARFRVVLVVPPVDVREYEKRDPLPTPTNTTQFFRNGRFIRGTVKNVHKEQIEP